MVNVSHTLSPKAATSASGNAILSVGHKIIAETRAMGPGPRTRTQELPSLRYPSALQEATDPFTKCCAVESPFSRTLPAGMGACDGRLHRRDAAPTALALALPSSLLPPNGGRDTYRTESSL